MASRLSLNLATIRPTRFEQKLEVALAAGFRAVGLLLAEMRERDEVGVEQVRASGLAVSDLGVLSGWMDPDRKLRATALAAAEESFRLAAELGCRLVIARPASGSTEVASAAEHFRALCHLGQPYRIRVGLEFVGGFEQVSNVAAAWEIVEAAEAENGGLVLDAFEFHRGGSSLDMVERIPGKKILLVQVSDCMEMPRHEMRDTHRVYPGTGVLSLEPMVAALFAKEYAGHYSLELLNEGYWRENPLVVAREGLRSMRRLHLV